jgi:hypothetical protein
MCPKSCHCTGADWQAELEDDVADLLATYCTVAVLDTPTGGTGGGASAVEMQAGGGELQAGMELLVARPRLLKRVMHTLTAQLAMPVRIIRKIRIVVPVIYRHADAPCPDSSMTGVYEMFSHTFSYA